MAVVAVAPRFRGAYGPNASGFCPSPHPAGGCDERRFAAFHFSQSWLPLPSPPSRRPPVKLLPRFAVAIALLALAAPSPRAATLQWSTDFEGGIPAEISAPGSQLDGVQGWAGLGAPGNQFGGQFLRYTQQQLYDTRLVLRNLPAHTHVSLGFLLAIIDSWDGVELMQVTVDGQLAFSHWFQIASGDTCDYPPPPGALLSEGRELGFSLGSWYARDRAYDLGADPAFQDIPHTADSLVVVWKLDAVPGGGANYWQGGGDESWAIDNVRVWLSSAADVPGAGPAALALAGAQPNPSRDGRLRVRMSLPASAAGRLEAFDAAGRRVASRDLGALGAGTHLVDLGDGAHFAPGLYLLRLTHGGESRTARAVVMR